MFIRDIYKNLKQDRFATLAVLCLLVIFAVSGRAQQRSVDAFEQNRRLGRGVNIIGYDPLWGNRDQGRFKEGYFKLLKEGGFNSVRVNLHAFRHMAAARDWALRDTWWDTLDWAVKNATRQGLMVILDLHEFGSMGEDPAGNRTKFLSFWRQVAGRYKDAPSTVIFEILNEPSRKLTPDLWNACLADALAIIRQADLNRTVIVGPAFWNGIDHLGELRLPENDRNLIVTVHYYKPMEFTHQGASWSEHKAKSGIEWAGTQAERQRVKEDFAKAAVWARTNNRPIFLGEFGAYDQAPMESRVRYTDFIARTAEANGWSWAYWQFDSDFILYDIPREHWVEPILRALIPAP